MNALACDLPAGFADPVSDANATFRAVLTAMSYPGRIVSLPVTVEVPAPLAPATGAILLALADLDTPVWLSADLDRGMVAAWLRFHCGCPLVATRPEAIFAVTTPCRDLDGFGLGSAESPERAATVIVQLADLASGDEVRLSGPGIATKSGLSVPGLDASFWRAVAANHQLFPEGVDIVLAAPDRLACLPRTTMVEETSPCMSR
ncbi:phosphonate C-P lyase system protein PhnH [Telmatospirillum sp.]|uniref:phosphonate C-P lyase system protein PhnH n=1 Tax=Telmatospirillum sp. TaxID=2079197 RepID=UPI00283DE123|nr:phosphonate C-P lyase system protein PhnH [Telmatospirillum sp.]MDR3440878.1 phosphonate C-P lyase system protein PhnH [Telmatospirillum sp.]